MKYILGIPHTSSMELLQRAVDSIPLYQPHTIVVDNSEGHNLRHAPSISGKVQIYRPPIVLSLTQVFNYLLQRGMAENGDAVLFMHEDAEATEGVPEQFLSLLEQYNQEGKRWGVAFTNYDALAAFNLAAVREVGLWDTNFYAYYADNDYYRRIRDAGYETVETELPVIHHVSITAKSNPYLKKVYSSVEAIVVPYYKTKWGE
ncbi:glycosyltransferase family 2 protein [Paenibacillus sp. y28]|uniref:glycosyltransferase family 2 protein n=1 Tax=Paenibacillus sp. y28 TaxID=3129110 RepID=UPI003015A0D2